ncbi:MAG: HIT family hydrolase [Candidatus Handelsmanbacteria bacterium RIFCSPLOWO2_12_FULL_64_10]|uniref:HIT family hydrolase n=1 Tax=Handelsmanbacteria sp. (strain RIFCSPLOWO2_12_FULL_64_10) TaxID=1817868 RepID=A0A1F6CAF3_HANXR|nr:MAG: HIT family hydrolase [Candidatus Handelsmanbacteria bacterium RIFCSPLOWO2_12_FULL_64_10]
MERLWAPWRMRYVAGAEKSEGCIFCEKWRGDADAENLVLFRGEECFAILNLFPYNNGHLMVVPVRHVADIVDLTASEQAEMFRLMQRMVCVLRETMSPHGFNIGFNLGRAAGAGIADHLHLHVVPRWSGDTNFMPVLDATRVISEALEETYRKLKAVISGQ